MNSFDTKERARNIRRKMLAISELIPDEKACQFHEFFRVWTPAVAFQPEEIKTLEAARPMRISLDKGVSAPVADGPAYTPVHYAEGQRVRFGDGVWKCKVSHDADPYETPDTLEELWEKLGEIEDDN